MIVTSSLRRITVATTAGAAIAVGLLTGSGIAAADSQQDMRFFNALQRFGISGFDPLTAVNDAHLVCAKLTGGEPAVTVVNQLQTAFPALDYQGRVDFAGAAVAEYCPGEEARLH